jgi:hypothetical protein
MLNNSWIGHRKEIVYDIAGVHWKTSIVPSGRD